MRDAMRDWTDGVGLNAQVDDARDDARDEEDDDEEDADVDEATGNYFGRAAKAPPAPEGANPFAASAANTPFSFKPPERHVASSGGFTFGASPATAPIQPEMDELRAELAELRRAQYPQYEENNLSSFSFLLKPRFDLLRGLVRPDLVRVVGADAGKSF